MIGQSDKKRLRKQQSSSKLANQAAFSRRKYECITDEDRLKLILLIKDFDMSCHKASKVLGIAYNNAKVIYRIYKNENRVKQTPKYLKRHAKTIKAQADHKR